MNDKTAMKLVKDISNVAMDREVLRFISQRQCTADRQEQCIVDKPKDPKDWCSRCLALDHLVNTEPNN